MKLFMVELALPSEFTAEFMDLIPAQRKRVADQFQEGKLHSYSLNDERSKLWALVAAEDQQGVMDVLAEWPMIRWMVPTIHGLFFHEAAQVALPSVSMN